VTEQPKIIDFEVQSDVDISTLVYTFGGAQPVTTVRPGEVLRTSTLDCFAGAIGSTSDLVSQVCDPRFLNPQTGPFYVEGAEPGDTLALHFVSIEPTYTYGFSTTVPLFGALTGTHATELLQPPLPEKTWRYELDLADRLVRYEALDSKFTADLPLDPMHGTVGVAPALNEVRSSLAPGDWGGNMDTPEMRAGTTAYFGVNVPGALFSIGDGHARQGEGETCGVAVECAMNTVLIVDLIKNYSTPWPRLESDEFLMTTGSMKPLEDAFRIAQVQMTRWIAELTGLSEMDAYQLLSQISLSPVAQVVDTVYTMVTKAPKTVLGDIRPMNGVHAKLRKQAATLAGR
jgi:acetamidase/formamidase